MADRERVADYIRRYSDLVGVAIEPLDAQGETRVASGSATVHLKLDASEGIILFLAPIMEVPPHDEVGLYRRLLELNFRATEESAFAIDQGRVYLRARCALSALDFDEFVDLLDSVARVADEWDHKLRAQFGS